MNATVQLLHKIARATVGLHTQIPAEHVSTVIGLGTDRRGTGTLISPDGLIVTVQYLLLGAQSVVVTLANGEQLPAKIVARDYNTGLGLLKIEGSKFPHVELISSSSCACGEEVFTVASLGGDKRCADTGMITYTGPFDALWEFVLDRSLCVTASSLNIGLSGGPICNNKGQVVGICYLNFADMGRAIMGIPGEYFLDARDELIRFGKRVSSPAKAWLGVLSYTLREHVVIAGVMPGSPGDKAGLQQGDLVMTVDGREVNERRAMYDLLRNHRPGDNVSLKVLRNNRIFQLEVPVVRPEDYFA